jgi:hypothetical protein
VGFSSPLFLLGLGAGSERAGFRSPLPVPPFGALPDAAEQAGFRNPLPLPPFGAGADERAGFATPLPFYFGYAGEPIEPPEPPIPIVTQRGTGWIDRDDEEVLAVIFAAAQRWG